MNLKEAFRFQNKLNSLLGEAELVLERDSNVMKVENTYLRKKVMAETENETVVDTPASDYAEKITELAGFTVFLLTEKEKLSKAIRTAKNGLGIDIDGETSMNGARQNAARIFKRMGDLRSSEVTITNGGTGYRFNTDGNQVSYKCDVRRVTTINFDRNVIRKYAKDLSRKADEFSAEIDKAIVNTEVGYDLPFDVNASFADAFETYCENIA
ncbi:MAG: hypothetical protein E7474_05455 [Ruminococcaceae bacterium]|nr:hypothetical protein [Oscillospiraceae bacterium]